MLLFFAGACGDSGLAADAQKLADEMCKCEDQACADKVMEKRSAFRKKAQEKYKKKEDVPKDLLEKMDKIDKQYKECRNKLREKTSGAEKAPAAPATE